MERTPYKLINIGKITFLEQDGILHGLDQVYARLDPICTNKKPKTSAHPHTALPRSCMWHAAWMANLCPLITLLNCMHQQLRCYAPTQRLLTAHPHMAHCLDGHSRVPASYLNHSLPPRRRVTCQNRLKLHPKQCKSKWRTMMCGTFQGYKKNTGARARHTLKEQAKCGYHVATKTQNKAQTEANRGNNCSPLYSKALYRRLPALVLPSLSSDASPLKLGHSSNIKLAWGAASLAKRSN